MLVVQHSLQASEVEPAVHALELLLCSLLLLGESLQAFPQGFSVLVDGLEMFLRQDVDLVSISNLPQSQIKQLLNSIKSLHEQRLKELG